MKIAVFYENIYEGAEARGVPMEKALRELKQEGMELIYISFDSLRRDREWLMPLLEKLELGIEGIHAFCDFALDPETPRCEEILDLAVGCGAGNVLFVPGMLRNGNTLRDYQNILSGMKRAVKLGSRRGLPVLMEDFDGLLAPYNSILSLWHFFDEIGELGCAFDTGNFVMFHEDELEAFELFRDRTVTLHIKDRLPEKRHPGDHPYTCADGKQVFSCQIGSGTIRIAGILRRLSESGYTGNIIAELYGVDRDYVLEDTVASVKYLKQLVG